MVNNRSLRFGRDDTSVLVEELFQDKSAELQIPPLRYASVGMTKGRVMLSLRFAMWDVNSRSLRFGRDDTSVLVEELFQDKSAEPQIPPLRYAPVGMTKGRVMLSLSFAMWDGEQQVPPLRSG